MSRYGAGISTKRPQSDPQKSEKEPDLGTHGNVYRTYAEHNGKCSGLENGGKMPGTLGPSFGSSGDRSQISSFGGKPWRSV